MERIDYLKRQAALLRGVAGTFDIPSIRNRLLALANECQILSRLIGSGARQRDRQPARLRPSAARSRVKRAATRR